MTTRSGNAADFHFLLPMMRQHRLRQQAFDPALYAPHPDAEARFRRWIGTVAQDPRATLLVAEDEAQIVGFLYATIEQELPFYRDEEFALIREWWVEPDLRRRGVGTALGRAARSCGVPHRTYASFAAPSTRGRFSMPRQRHGSTCVWAAIRGSPVRAISSRNCGSPRRWRRFRPRSCSAW